MLQQSPPGNIDEYISSFPKNIQSLLQELRNIIRKAAPEAEERISYKMPAFYQKGILVYFAAFKNHIGFFPTASGIAAFENELSEYKTSKGTIQFPLDKPLPPDLVSRIVKFRIGQNMGKSEERRRVQ